MLRRMGMNSDFDMAFAWADARRERPWLDGEPRIAHHLSSYRKGNRRDRKAKKSIGKMREEEST